MTFENPYPPGELANRVPVPSTAGALPAYPLKGDTPYVVSEEQAIAGAARTLLALGWSWKPTESGAWGLFPAWVGGEVRRG
jgi:hypothetical protein